MTDDSTPSEEQKSSGKHSLFSTAGLAGAAGSLVCVFTLTGFLGRWLWLFDLTSHFRVQYFFLLLLASVIVCIARQFKLAAVFASFALLNGLVILPLLLSAGATAEASDSGPRLKLVSVNLNSGNQNVSAVESLLKSEDPDLVLLMEFNDFWDHRLQEALEGYSVKLRKPRNDNFGIALFSKPIPASNAVWLASGAARLPSIHAPLHRDVTFHFVGTHSLPPAGARYTRARNAQLEEIAEHVRRLEGPVILAGDFNLTPWSPLFSKLLKETGLKNGADGFGLQWTWPAFFPPMGIPIDHFLHNNLVRVSSFRNGPDIGSDHLPLIIEFQVVAEE